LLLLPCQRLEATSLMKLLIQVHKQPLIRGLVQIVAEVAFRCLSCDKDARPTMIEVAEELLLRQHAYEDPLTVGNYSTAKLPLIYLHAVWQN
jgi:hypothetical protein